MYFTETESLDISTILTPEIEPLEMEEMFSLNPENV